MLSLSFTLRLPGRSTAFLVRFSNLCVSKVFDVARSSSLRSGWAPLSFTLIPFLALICFWPLLVAFSVAFLALAGAGATTAVTAVVANANANRRTQDTSSLEIPVNSPPPANVSSGV